MSETDDTGAGPGPDRRWPRSVYGVGEEPDPRFTFANERTFLAWIRTALALIAAGVALTAYGEVTDTASWPVVVGSLLLTAAGVVSGIGAFAKWASNERAMRQSRPLPSTPLLALLVGILVVFGLAAVALSV